MSVTDMIVPGLTFNKAGLGKVGKDDSYNMLTYILVGLYVIVVPLTHYLMEDIPPATGYSDTELTGFGLFLGLFVYELLGTFLEIFLISIIAKYLMKVEMSFAFVLRVFAAVIVWNYLLFVVSIFVDISFGAFIFILIFNVALMIGLTNTEGLVMWKSFLTILLAYAITIGLGIVSSIIFESLFT